MNPTNGAKRRSKSWVGIGALIALFSVWAIHFSIIAGEAKRSAKREFIALARPATSSTDMCGLAADETGLSELSSEISVLIDTLNTTSGAADMPPLCIMEVGTADGKGTTRALHAALRRHCLRTGRTFRIFTYEALPELAVKAKTYWEAFPSVEVVGELVLEERHLEDYIISNIEGPAGDTYPGVGFYRAFYRATVGSVREGKLGGFFEHPPQCRLDLVVIDSTRYAHAGIVQTLMDVRGSRLVTPETLFLIENDHWDVPPVTKAGGRIEVAKGAVGDSEGRRPAADERAILERHWELRGARDLRPHGEMWPWLSFRIGGRFDEASSSGDADASIPAPASRAEHAPAVLAADFAASEAARAYDAAVTTASPSGL